MMAILKAQYSGLFNDWSVWCTIVQNMVTSAQFAPEYFKVLHSSPNGTFNVVQTLQRGQTTLHGQLHAVTGPVRYFFL